MRNDASKHLLILFRIYMYILIYIISYIFIYISFLTYIYIFVKKTVIKTVFTLKYIYIWQIESEGGIYIFEECQTHQCIIGLKWSLILSRICCCFASRATKANSVILAFVWIEWDYLTPNTFYKQKQTHMCVCVCTKLSIA